MQRAGNAYEGQFLNNLQEAEEKQNRWTMTYDFLSKKETCWYWSIKSTHIEMENARNVERKP
jgi:hypothetical protein